ncbi:hypothetical protein K435DRAFT_789519 [Dendrothele bispora CBS 962.96]|uniref:Uncharacterized protein n=1 Tax=Dendrothele bispora (strain CBS 962.96) TaxID=1314807 RepID=A0A4S8MT60_DENBC|nr:hypothetical protein K435DRAFT_789519 [Dendrothele bispora CBS 962.96]
MVISPFTTKDLIHKNFLRFMVTRVIQNQAEEVYPSIEWGPLNKVITPLARAIERPRRLLWSVSTFGRIDAPKYKIRSTGRSVTRDMFRYLQEIVISKMRTGLGKIRAAESDKPIWVWIQDLSIDSYVNVRPETVGNWNTFDHVTASNTAKLLEIKELGHMEI